jgi:SOS response regulatory protein OraA/RecX
MKYLKKYDSFNESAKYGPNNTTDISEDIAEDIIDKLVQIRKEKGKFTVEDFIEYMEERGSDDKTTDSVMHYLVNKGFDFDVETEEPLTDEEIAQIKVK